MDFGGNACCAIRVLAVGRGWKERMRGVVVWKERMNVGSNKSGFRAALLPRERNAVVVSKMIKK